MRRLRASAPWVEFQFHHLVVAVEFVGGHGAVGSVSGLEHDDRDHQRGGKAGGEGGGICVGHGFRLLSLEAGDHPPARQAPEVSERVCNHPRAFGRVPNLRGRHARVSRPSTG
nr:hypothetical protein SHINE37_41350 [Rhizobiaceae bacterium]